jgi:hypothetical protein
MLRRKEKEFHYGAPRLVAYYYLNPNLDLALDPLPLCHPLRPNDGSPVASTLCRRFKPVRSSNPQHTPTERRGYNAIKQALSVPLQLRRLLLRDLIESMPSYCKIPNTHVRWPSPDGYETRTEDRFPSGFAEPVEALFFKLVFGDHGARLIDSNSERPSQ